MSQGAIVALLAILSGILGFIHAQVYVKVAHFIRISIEDNSVFLHLEQKEEVKAFTVSPYFPINENHIHLTYSNKQYHIDLNGTNHTRLTVVLTWSNKFSYQIFQDIEDRRVLFDELNKNRLIPLPYSNNTLWRLIPVNQPFIKYEVRVKQLMDQGEEEYRVPKEFNGTGYFLDNSYASKSVKIYEMDPDSPPPGYRNLPQELQFGSQGIYTVFYTGDRMTDRLEVTEDFEPENNYIPLVFLAVFILLWIIIRNLVSYNIRKKAKKIFYVPKMIRVQTKEEREVSLLTDELAYVDAFRGLAIILFIFVQAGGGNYPYLNESPWDGFTIGDLPKFMIPWIMGVCIPLRLDKNPPTNKIKAIINILPKTIFMAMTGFVYNKNQRLSEIKYTGFLQRLAVAQLVVSALHILLPYNPSRKKETGYKSPRYLTKIFIISIFPILNLLITFYFNAPGCPVGYTGPGSNSTSLLAKCTGGMNLYVDTLIFGEKHIPTNPKCRDLFGCERFDQDGIMGTLNFIFGVYLGSLVSSFYIQFKKYKMRQLSYFLYQMLILGLISAVFIGIPPYRLIQPNSQIWSITYVTLSSTICLGILLVLAILTSQKIFFGWPFKAVGKNAVFILVFQQLMIGRFPFGFHHNGNRFNAVLSALLSCTCWVLIALTLHKYRFYIKY